MIDSRCSDSQLVSLYQTGNEEAFEMLLLRHKSRIYTAIYLIVKDRYVAEDLLQETFIKVVNTIKSGRYNEEGKFLPWLSRVAHNLAIDYFRRRKRYPEIVLEDGSRVFNSLDFAEESFESAQVYKETKSRLRDLIKELPEEQKHVLIMRHFLQMSFQEIADRTGVSINTALGRMRYALINLRKKMIKNHIAMTKTFTQNDLIRYLYHETSEKETKEINKSLICDSELQAQFKELLASKNQLDSVQYEPSKATVQSILNYARGLQEKH